MSRLSHNALAAALLLSLALAAPVAAQDVSDPYDAAAQEGGWESEDAAPAEASEDSGESSGDDTMPQDAAIDEAAAASTPQAADAEEDASDSKQLKRKLKGFLAGLLLPVVEKRLRKAAGQEEDDAGLTATDDETDEP